MYELSSDVFEYLPSVLLESLRQGTKNLDICCPYTYRTKHLLNTSKDQGLKITLWNGTREPDSDVSDFHA
jgi:hypothetical protein